MELLYNIIKGKTYAFMESVRWIVYILKQIVDM